MWCVRKDSKLCWSWLAVLMPLILGCVVNTDLIQTDRSQTFACCWQRKALWRNIMAHMTWAGQFTKPRCKKVKNETYGSFVFNTVQRQRLIQSANGSSKPLQNGRHQNIENGNIPVVNQEEENEQDNLSPFSLPGKLPDAYSKKTSELKC